MSHAPNDFALVIGINDYPSWGNKGKSLLGPIADANRFAAWLRDPKGGGLLYQRVRLLTSAPNPPSPLQDVVDTELQWIKAELQRADVNPHRFYFYFSGHGHVRHGQEDDTPALCLPNWSPQRRGAALSLRSYINAIVGCFGFQQGVFFLDCCRSLEVAPVGKTSDFDCGTPKFEDRYYAIAYAAEPLTMGYEGPVDGEIRGYFTAALLEILQRGSISLTDLKRELEQLVPKRSDNKQTPRVPYDVPSTVAEAMTFGPPFTAGRPPMPPALTTEKCWLHVHVSSDLKTLVAGEEERVPRPGRISVFDAGGELVARADGDLSIRVPHGPHVIRIEHGEAAEEMTVEISGERNVDVALPPRRSAAPLSGTTEKDQSFADMAERLSGWQAAEGQQGLFVFVRPTSPDNRGIAASVVLYSPEGEPFALESTDLLDDKLGSFALWRLVAAASPGTWRLRHGEGINSIELHVPVMHGWDTQVFVLASNRHLHLDRATVLMRKAGLGFDRRDGLVDVYERALVDLATGGRGPGKEVLDNLLWGKYRNPLFGLVGAYFLLNQPDGPNLPAESAEVIGNLVGIMGNDVPDIQALQLRRARRLGEPFPELNITGLPLLAAGLLEFLRASADRPQLMANVPELEQIALTRIADSPWTCWRGDGSSLASDARGKRGPLEVAVNQLEQGTRRVIKSLGLDNMLGGLLQMGPRGTILRDNEAGSPAPKWMVDFVREEVERSNRTGLPFDVSALARRTALPIDLLNQALKFF